MPGPAVTLPFSSGTCAETGLGYLKVDVSCRGFTFRFCFKLEIQSSLSLCTSCVCAHEVSGVVHCGSTACSLVWCIFPGR